MTDESILKSQAKIGQLLLGLRNIRNEKQVNVAIAAGISVSALSKIECGKYKNLTIAILMKLADHYNIKLEYVIPKE